MSATNPIKLFDAALSEHNGEIKLRGVLANDSLPLLKIADYQREILPGAKAKDLLGILQAGRKLGDITLGMRGGSFTEKPSGTFLLENGVYIIDGLQRRTASLEFLNQQNDPHLGAYVHFNTVESWEREEFLWLNTIRTDVSSSKNLYNARHTNAHVKMLYDLCQDSTFVLYERVCWDQIMKRTHLVSATALVNMAGELHHHFKVSAGYNVLRVAVQLNKMKIPRNAVRQNVKVFWELLDINWNVRDIVYKTFAPHIKRSFVNALCKVFARHEDFWEDSYLKVSLPLRKKLATFPLKDPRVSQLCSAGGNAASILVPLLIDHLNSGKRTCRLKPFIQPDAIEDESLENTWIDGPAQDLESSAAAL